jgi:NAD(P)H-hydrate epimerase
MIRLTRAQVREIDRRAIEDFHIPGIVLMENAAREAGALARRLLHDHHTGNAVILCGGGNNGGDGLAIARHLHNAGVNVRIMLSVDPAKYQRDALTNWRIVEAMKLPAEQAEPQTIKRLSNALIVDAIFGTGLMQRPRDPFPSIVAAVKASGCPVLAVDVPSGLDCDTGRPFGPCIEAHSTITFVAQKAGFDYNAARYLGDCFVGDIGCPRELIEEVAKMTPT